MVRHVYLLAALASVVFGCNDLTLQDGSDWHDSGGAKYTCQAHYKNYKKCQTDGGKYAFEDMTANIACCNCGGGDAPGTATLQPKDSSNTQSSESCTVDDSWVHPTYGDTCADYEEGGKSAKHKCKDTKAKKACCHKCTDSSSTSSSEKQGNIGCSDLTLGNGKPWHDEGGVKFTCEYYGAKKNRCSKDGGKYAFEGLTANDACCACGGGSCSDKTLADGSDWHDEGGEKYTCSYYGEKKKRCANDGDKFPFEGMAAKDACCVCGGGVKAARGGELLGEAPPEPDKGDILYEGEWLGPTKFENKKHLQMDMILYWNVDIEAEIVTVGLLGPKGHTSNSWISIGFSEQEGLMAGSDAVVAWFEGSKPVINDYYLMNQAPSGIKPLGRQAIQNTSLSVYDGRMQLVFSRKWVPETGVAVRPYHDWVRIIYSKGAASSKCYNGFCNHAAGERASAKLAFYSPDGMTPTWQFNLGTEQEPCDGPADLMCFTGFGCYHEFATDGDHFAKNNQSYGVCASAESLGAEENEETWTTEQNVFQNDGGFENHKSLHGGFQLLWTVNKVSPDGEYGPDDTINMAMVSTMPNKQGWIGFGLSPDGQMKGSDVVIGWSADGGENEFIGDFFLEGQVSSLNTPKNKQELKSVRVLRKNGQLAIMFERPLTPADSVQIVEGEMNIIFAAGPTPDVDDQQYIPYHKFRGSDLVDFLKTSSGDVVREMEICGGDDNITCVSGLECMLFPPEYLDFDWKQRWDLSDESGFTSDTEYDQTGRGLINVIKNSQEFVGKGLCVTPAMASNFAEIDLNSMGLLHSFDWWEYPHYQNLKWGFELFWKLNLERKVVEIALVCSLGPGWLGIGFGTMGQMLGASSIIGWADSENPEKTNVQEYYLDEKLPWEVKPQAPGSQTLLYASKVKLIPKGYEVALLFEKPMNPDNGIGAIEQGKPTTILWAHGVVPRKTDDYFGYHRYRDAGQVVFWPADETA